MKYTPPIKRVETAKGHYYCDANGLRVPGVTTWIGNGIPKPALIAWAANATAEYAVDRWDELTELSPSARLKTLQGARYEATDKAKKRGTETHRYAEKLVAGEQVSGIPDELRGHVEAYVRFLDQFDVEPILVEATVVSYKYGYAGTLDLIADLTENDGTRQRYLLDIKTSEKGLFPETALQLAAYRFADKYVDASGEELDMIPVAATGAILVNSEGAQLIPTISTENQLRTFWYAGQIRDFVENGRDLIGPSIEPRSSEPSKARVVWDE